jgi:hypothetical protein
MGEPDSARSQRVDMLGFVGQESRNASGTCRESAFASFGGKAQTVLLDRLYSPHG